MRAFILFGVHEEVVEALSDLVPVRQVTALNVPGSASCELPSTLGPAHADNLITKYTGNRRDCANWD